MLCRIVALLERVQGGIIGQTLSSFGITGLYITFVFGIGRFLRFSTQHARMRIPFEDLPTTQRLIALCQARTSALHPCPYARALHDPPKHLSGAGLTRSLARILGRAAAVLK